MSEQNVNQTPVQQNVTQNAAALKRFQEETTEHVLERIKFMQDAGAIKLPANYAAGNAIKLGWLYLMEVVDKNNKPAVDVCTKESICNAFLKMAIKGLSVAKKQCYFIVRGTKLCLDEDYRGNLMIAKRDTEIADVNPQVIYEEDSFVYTVDENGLYQLVKHETSLTNINIDKITGAYAVVINKDGSKRLEVMTMAQIRNAWLQGGAGGKSGAHTKFTDQMCKKTVSNRACKVAIGSSDDAGIMDDVDEDTEMSDSATMERVQANKAFTDAQVQDVQFETVVVQETPQTAKQPAKQQTTTPKVTPTPAEGSMNQADCPL